MTRPLAPVVLALGLLLQPASAQTGTDADGGPTLEAFLARARAERDALHARLGVEAQRLVAELEADTKPGRLSLENLRIELDRLGPEAAPVLVPYLEPGTEPTDGTKFRAEEITAALQRARPAGIVAELALYTQRGSEAGRIHAIRVLGSVPERESAGEHLARIFEASKGALRLESARSLGALGGNASTLQRALQDDDPEVVRTVLAALTDWKNVDAAPAVLALAREPQSAAPVVAELVAYWRASPEVVDMETLSAMIRLTLRQDVASADRVALLDAIPAFEEAEDRAVRRELEPVASTPDAAVREAALICMVLLGDRGKRRVLLDAYDQPIEAQGDYWKDYSQRGAILVRIGDYSAAAKDYERAIELLARRSRNGRATNQDLWIDLARSHVLAGKLAKAVDALEDMGLTRSLKERLRADPDFRELVESSRYGRVLE